MYTNTRVFVAIVVGGTPDETRIWTQIAETTIFTYIFEARARKQAAQDRPQKYVSI